MDPVNPRSRPRSTLSPPRGSRGRSHAPTFPAPVKLALVAMAGVAVSLVSLAAYTNRPLPGPEGSEVEVALAGTFLESRLPVEVNEEVERWIHRFLGPERAGFEGYLVREGLYGGLIREKLRERGMPQELLYLAMIESGFLASATSRVSASGVWQFMGATARAYGLTVDGWVDERRDPVRATDAALDYLEELHGMFGSWHLAAAAYNAGPAAVTRALQRERIVPGSLEAESEDLFWRVSRHLPRETREYVPKMLAATLLAEQAEHFGFDVEKSLPYLFDKVLVPGGTALGEVARALELEPTLIRELNPHLVRGVTPPGEATLVRVPLGESHRLVASLSDGTSVRGD